MSPWERVLLHQHTMRGARSGMGRIRPTPRVTGASVERDACRAGTRPRLQHCRCMPADTLDIRHKTSLGIAQERYRGRLTRTIAKLMAWGGDQAPEVPLRVLRRHSGSQRQISQWPSAGALSHPSSGMRFPSPYCNIPYCNMGQDSAPLDQGPTLHRGHSFAESR